MQIRLGYELVYDCPQPTPMLLMLNVHYTRVSDVVVPSEQHPAHRPGADRPWSRRGGCRDQHDFRSGIRSTALRY